MKNLSAIDYASLALSVLLLVCLFDMPYGYYSFVRVVTTILMLCHLVTFIEQKERKLAIVAGTLAIVFQPFIRISFGREFWFIMDICLALALIGYVVWKIKGKNKEKGKSL